MTNVPRQQRTISGLPRSRDDIQREQAEEIEQHISARAAELVAAGMTEQIARAQAESEFGDVSRAHDELSRADERGYRAHRRRVWTGDLMFDVRYAVRSLRRSPGFTFVVLLTLALGMGATTSIFSVFNAYLLRPLPFPAADRLVLVNDVQPNYGPAPASFGEFTDWQQIDGPFEAVAALSRRSLTYEGPEYPERIRVGIVSDQFFTLTAPRVMAGRLFTVDEQLEGAPATAVLTSSFWRTRLNADTRVIGNTIRLDGAPVTVIGVIADLPHLWAGDPISAYQPLVPNAPWRDRGTHYLTVWGRLRPELTIESANARLAAPVAALQEERDTDHSIAAVPLRDLLIGQTRPLFVVIMITVMLVLIIACANVANLMLARTARREQEFALRGALGAGRFRIVRQLLTEGFVLALLGCTAGVLLGAFGARALLAALPENMPRPPFVTLDVRVLALAAAAVLGATLLFGMTPILVELRATLSSLLRASRGGGGWTARGRLARHGLVVLELALCMVLLAGASLMIRSFSRLMRIDPGITADGVIAFQIHVPSSRYDSPERRSQFFADFEERLRGMPQVDAVGAALNLPLASGGMSGDFAIEGTPAETQRTRPQAEKRIVTPAYFDALGIRLLSGRLFTEQDRAGQPNVVVINETTARTMWPNENPIGKRINGMSDDDAWEEIIGVVADVRAYGLAHRVPLELLYPLAQQPSGGMVMIVRSRSDTESLLPQLRAELREIDPLLPLYNVRVMEDIVAQTVAGKRLLLLLSTSLGLLALILAAIGTAGIIAYGVARRTREIGVRIALGARPREVLGLIMSEALTLAVVGVLIGLVGAVAMGDVLRSQLFEIAPTDGAAYFAAVMTLLAVAALAAYFPARRVLKVDPLSAISHG